MTTVSDNLWTLVRKQPEIDPRDLALAVQNEASGGDLDYRTRLLIRDSVDALRGYWGPERLESWLKACPVREHIEAIAAQSFERAGFPSLGKRLMEKTDPDDIRAYLRAVGSHLHRGAKIYIGGSVALLLTDYLARHTEDIDVVDEVPEEIRNAHRLLDQLEKTYALHIAHFQSHYLPTGWEARSHSLEPFGRLQVLLIDVYDVILSKMFSAREKDLGDLRVLIPKIDKETLVQRLKDTTQRWQQEIHLKERALRNWYILFGEESLPQ
jgi:Nucleotidyltransferase of unknown function (DUF6036)